MFDPEKVERFDVDGDPISGFRSLSDSHFVLSADYDQLLDIHLRHIGMIAGLFERCGEPLSEEKIAALKNGMWS
jgi:hypothetical protein